MQKQELNILFTCAGRRSVVMEAFADALGGDGRVLAADCRADAPALSQASRGFVVPEVGDPEYVERLLEICHGNGVRLLVPLNDLELPLLAREERRFAGAGTRVLVSRPEVVDVCFDKWRTASFARELGIGAPQTFLNPGDALGAVRAGEVGFPLVLKPRWGSASIGVELVEEEAQLEPMFELARRRLRRTILAGAGDGPDTLLIQERLGGREYGLDVVNDLEGRHVGTFVRRKLGMRAGETDRAETVEHPALEAMGAVLGRALGHVGVLDCDAFVEGDRCTLLEMNPRFGGGYPFTQLAGANVPAYLVAQLRGEEADPAWLRMRPGVVGAKYERVAQVAGAAD